MLITFQNSGGEGFADQREVPEGSTIENVFEVFVGGSPDDYVIRVNQEPAGRHTTLNSGDSVLITPRKIAGAAL